MKTLTFLMILTPILLAQDLLFEDAFNDGNADGWYEKATGVTYFVNSNLRYEMTYSGTEDVYGLSYRGDNGTTMSEESYSVLFETIVHYPTSQVGVDVRFTEADGTCYTFYLSFIYGTYYIIRYDSFTTWVMLGSVLYYPDGFQYDKSYWVRFECIGSTFRAKIWTGGAGDEPSSWGISRNDATYQNNGCMGLELSSAHPTTYFCAEFDNVVVTGFPVGLESTTWGAIKSSF